MFWRIGQVGAVATILLLIITAILWPTVALPVFWNVVVPLVPISLLIAPAVWRGICPLVTANTMTNGLVAQKHLSARSRPYLQGVSLTLLFLLIPARRFLLNENGLVLAILLALLLVLAMVAGSLFASKAGFCNSICPVLPVEKLYGQHPLVALENVRCSTCDLCTAKGCFDLAPEKSALQAAGPNKNDRHWLVSGFGVFALAFPGLIFGYFQLVDVPLDQAISVYGTTLGLSVVSYSLLAAAFGLLRTKTRFALPILAALAIGIYYWFAPIGTAETLGQGVVFIAIVRVVTLSVVAYWLYVTMKSRLQRRLVNSRPPLHKNAVPLESSTTLLS